MASGTINLGTNGKLTGQLVWSSTSNGTQANSSTVTISVQAKKTSSTEATKGTWTGTVQIGENIEDYSFYASINTSWVTLKTYTKTIEHQNSGYADVYLFGSITGPTGTTLSGKSIGSGGSVKLDTIPRASVLGAISEFTLGNNITIPITKYVDSFTDDLDISLNGTNIKKVSGITNNQSISFITAELSEIYALLPNSTSGTFTFKLTTKNGSSTIGTSSKSVKGTINTNTVRPSFPTFTTEEVGEVPIEWGIIVKNKSKLKFNVSTTAGEGATLTSLTTKFDGITYTSEEFETEVIKTAGNLTVDISATDSRGIISSSARAITIIDYDVPYITSASAIRSDSSGTFDENGTYLKVELVAGVYSIENKNTASFEVHYKKTTEESWTIRTIGNNSLTYDGYVRIPGLDIDSSYDVKIVVKDYFGEVTKLLPTISSAFTTVDYKNGGHGVAFGKVAEKEDTLEVNFDAEFNKDVNVVGNLSVNSILVNGQELPKQLNEKSTSTVDGYSCDYINKLNTPNDLKQKIFSSTLLGGESVTLSEVKRYLDVYFRVNFSQADGMGKYTIDTTQDTSLMYSSGVIMAFDGSSGQEYYVSESSYNKNTRVLTHTRTGYFDISKGSYTDRNGNESYYIYQIDTYD